MAAIAPIADMEDQPIADGAVQPVEHKPPEKLSDKDKPIPLLCTICPKKPKFSDTSHLLTHLNSKGHLANCQQVDLRAQSDPAYRQIKNGYDAWYSENNLLSLLTERQVAKDQKDAKKDASKRKRSRESNLVSWVLNNSGYSTTNTKQRHRRRARSLYNCRSLISSLTQTENSSSRRMLISPAHSSTTRDKAILTMATRLLCDSMAVATHSRTPVRVLSCLSNRVRALRVSLARILSKMQPKRNLRSPTVPS